MRNRSLITLAFAVAALAALPSWAAAQEIYMSGLSSPRGMNFGADGTLYVTEAGVGGGPNGQAFQTGAGPATFGLNGGISSKTVGGVQQRIVSNLPSLAAANGSDAVGAHDVIATSDGRLAVLFGYGTGSGTRSQLGSGGAMLGTLSYYDLTTHAWTTSRDYARMETALNPDGGDDNSDPYSFVPDGAGYAVADAGANAIWRDSGATAIPGHLAPLGPAMIPQQSVPTSIVARPGGGFLVGELGGFPFAPGYSNVDAVGANGAFGGVVKSGFTSIIDMVNAPDGSLLVLELYSNGVLAGGLGDLKRLQPNGTVDTVMSNLSGATSLAFGPDGMLYITDNGLSGTDGLVRRYTYTPVPEPASFAAVGVGLWAFARRRRLGKGRVSVD